MKSCHVIFILSFKDSRMILNSSINQLFNTNFNNQQHQKFMSLLQEGLSFLQENLKTCISVAVFLILYAIYLWFFKYHEVIMKGDYNTKVKDIGKTLPPYPNGWYIACKSSDLPVGESKAIDMAGHNVTIFRAKDGKVFGLYSYCAHLGANMGIGGKVVN